MPGQDDRTTPDGMWRATMGAFQISALVYKAIGTKVDVFHKEQRRSGPLGWWGPLVDTWVPANADSIVIRNTYYGATAAGANAFGLGNCPPPGTPSGPRPSMECKLWAAGVGGTYTFDTLLGFSGEGPGGLPTNPGPSGNATLDVRAVSGKATVTIGHETLSLSVESAGFPPTGPPL